MAKLNCEKCGLLKNSCSECMHEQYEDAKKLSYKLHKKDNPNYMIKCLECEKDLGKKAQKPVCRNCRRAKERKFLKEITGTSDMSKLDDFTHTTIEVFKRIRSGVNNFYELGCYVDALRDCAKEDTMESREEMVSWKIEILKHFENVLISAQEGYKKILNAFDGNDLDSVLEGLDTKNNILNVSITSFTEEMDIKDRSLDEYYIKEDNEQDDEDEYDEDDE